MLNIMLIAVIIFLLIALVLLFLRLQKLQKNNLEEEHERSTEEEIFFAISLPIAFKKEHQWYYNKAFKVAFGELLKPTLEALEALPRNGSTLLELTYDNAIQKATLIHSSNFFNRHNTEVFIYALNDVETLHKRKMLLLKQKEQCELALESCDEALWDWDTKSDILFYSTKWKKIMGYDANDEEPHTLSAWLNMVDAKDMARVNEALRKHLDGNSHFFCIEHRLRNSEPVRWIMVRGKAIVGAQNQAIRMIGTVRDITKEKLKKIKENTQQERFSAFVENVPFLGFIKNTQGNYLYANASFQKFIGFKSWFHRNDTLLFDATTAEKLTEIERLCRYEGLCTHQITLPNAEGVLIPFELHTFIIDEANEKLLCGLYINKSFK